MVSNPFLSTSEILNIITDNSFKITFQVLKLLKRQACLKVYYLLFTQLTHCGRKKKVFCVPQTVLDTFQVCIFLFYELVLVVHWHVLRKQWKYFLTWKSVIKSNCYFEQSILSLLDHSIYCLYSNETRCFSF